MSPSGPRSICSEADRVISTFSFDPNLEPSPQNLHRGEASGPPKSISGMIRLRSSGMPHEGYADPVMSGGPRFHLDVPVSELAERDTRAIEASVVSSTPLVVKTTDRVSHKTRSTSIEPNEARGLEPSDPNSGIQLTRVRRLAREGLEATLCRTEPREKM